MISNKYYFYIAISISFAFLLIFTILSYFGLIQSNENIYLIGEASRWCERVSEDFLGNQLIPLVI